MMAVKLNPFSLAATVSLTIQPDADKQRGQVRCRHVTCPSLNCSDPHHVAGKCCPVCYSKSADAIQLASAGRRPSPDLVIGLLMESAQTLI